MLDPHGSSVPLIDATLLRHWLGGGQEIALVDVRDGGPFSRSHLLLASNLPLAQLEARAPYVLPRRNARIVLMDDGERFAERAAAVLRANGYSAVSILRRGVSGWREAGYELFSGTNVPSKAFGEFVEHRHDTPRIEPEELFRWQEEGRDIVVVDSRPLEEYRAISIPGASDCPGAELVLRVPAILKSPQTTVVVNCAGRTRSIIGCQSLRNAGLPNPIYALKNGTMGWELAGMKTAHGHDNMVPEPSDEGLAAAQRLAADVARRHKVSYIEPDRLATMLAESDRTTYVFDVRLPDAYAAGHRPGSRNAPGGQLVQATDSFVGVRGSRIVLVDRHGVQAVMTAHWLLQMGWPDVFVLRGGLEGPLETGPATMAGLGEARLTAPQMQVGDLQAALHEGKTAVVDVGDSHGYRTGRIPGAWYAMRSRLGEALARFQAATPLVFVCADGRVSRYAAQDALALGFSNVSALEGGRAAWRAATLPTEVGSSDDDPKLLTATDDMWYPPWARQSGVQEAMQQYLTWEVNLLQQLEREPYLRFHEPQGA
jgi:rhodanese-related sulfurtransferase